MRNRCKPLFLALVAGALAFPGGSLADVASADEWQADSHFNFAPSQFPGFVSGATDVTYRLLDPQGYLSSEWSGPASHPVSVVVPSSPGTYSFEARLEDGSGNELSRRTTLLHFDDAVPATPSPRAPEGWLPGTKPVVLQLDPLPGPLPISGIRAYELTLATSGVRLTTSGDSISLGFLPEGLNQAQVVAVSGSGVRSQPREVSFAIDATAPGVSLAGLPGGWSNRPVELTAEARDPLSGMEAAGPAGPFTAIGVDGGAPSTALGGTASAWIGGSGIHTVRFYGRDAAGNVGDGQDGSSPPGTALVPIDEAAPKVEFAAAQDPADPERIEALVGDSLSGPSSSRGQIAIRPAGTRARFEPLPTRVEPGRLVARWDSDAYPAGKYEFLATGYDAAGNSTAGSERVHGSKMVLVNPLKVPVTLRSALRGSRIAGSLRRSLGGPVSGQAVTIIETFAAGSDRGQRATSVHTASDGTFALRLRPGPSREVTASFGGNAQLSRAAGPVARLAAATKVRFAGSSPTAVIGGRAVVFSGRVLAAGARRALAGLPVELQFRYPGAAWSEFRTVEADSRGRFRYAYRFSDDDSRGVRFRFRAYVKGREGWPYGPGASRPVSVRGR